MLRRSVAIGSSFTATANAALMSSPNKTGDNETADASTIAVFQAEWDTYRKAVENNFLFHREAYARLHEVVTRDFPQPFEFLDIACGDASASASALIGTSIARYTGIDFSSLALALAAKNLAALGCPVDLVKRDFLDAIDEAREPVDIVWIGLSLHHLRAPGKLDFMRKTRRILRPHGRLMIFENTSLDGEDRASWLDRWDEQRTQWTAYSPEEWTRMANHVHAADFPETVSTWRLLGRDAGFRSVEDLYTTPTNFFRVWSFST
jgi:SAM-dependent methyltransferase